METKIVIDSALNIPAELLKKYGIYVVPVSLSIDGVTYRENVDASSLELVGLIGSAKHATTSQPAPGDFVQMYEKLTEAQHILSIHVTGKLSGTLQTARIGADMVAADKVITFDSESISMGGGWQALAAVQALAAGKSLSQVISLLEEIRPQIGTYLSMPSLKYLQKSGRVNLGKALLANLLSVKPVFFFSAGLLTPISKARSMQGANKEIVALLKQRFGKEVLAVAIMHAEDENTGRQLQKMASEELNVAHTLLEDITSSLVVHGGPGTIAIAVIPYKYVKDIL